MNQNYVQ